VSLLPEDAILPVIRLRVLVVGGLIFLLQACSTTPEPLVVAPPAASAPPAVTKRVPVGELTLNLPEQGADSCNCDPPVGVDRIFLEKGFSYLAVGDYREAVNYFRRYQRLESSPGADWEANIAVAYVKMIPDSPYYNWRASRESYLRLMRAQPTGIQLDEQIVLMRDMLAILINLHVRLNDLQSENAVVSENLQKREEALRRLRELMLGQKAELQ
jgi:tetratricopeptide (TPR) repeat protein